MIRESKGAVVRARCSEELKKRVADFATRFGIEEADVVRFSLEDYIGRNHDADHLEFRRADLVRIKRPEPEIIQIRRVVLNSPPTVTPETIAAGKAAAKAAPSKSPKLS